MRHYFLLSVLLSPLLSFAASTPLDTIAAVVDEDVVLNSELEQRLVDIRFQYRNRQQSLPPEDVLKKQVLEQLIVQRIQLSQAERAGVRIDDNSLNAYLNDVASQSGLSLNDFRAKLESEKAGTYQEVREQIRQ